MYLNQSAHARVVQNKAVVYSEFFYMFGIIVALPLRKHTYAIYRDFLVIKKLKISLGKKKNYVCSKHSLWVQVRIASPSTHSLCFESKRRKLGIPL